MTKLHGGKKPSVSCDSGALNQAWYFYNVKGNAIDGKYEPAEPRKFPLHILSDAFGRK